ncbi:MAG: DedA family protein [Salinibacter sp.]|uniref:DedA family protein n=1 Tax=Salinibacter sp. TaxID=2065818 RepID=UPI0035D4383F
MPDWFSHFFIWMQGLSPVWAYLTLFVVAYGENVVPPIPGDMVVVFAGYMAGIGQLHLSAVVALSTTGGAAGFMTMYAAGYKLGEAVLDPDRLRWMPRQGFDRAQRWIRTYGYGVIAANRFLSGARSVISLTAGMFQMEPGRTAWWCTASALVWTGLISYAGYAVGENWSLVVQYLRAYGRIVLVLLLLIAAGLLFRWYWHREESPSPQQAGTDGTRSEGKGTHDS